MITKKKKFIFLDLLAMLLQGIKLVVCFHFFSLSSLSLSLSLSLSRAVNLAKKFFFWCRWRQKLRQMMDKSLWLMMGKSYIQYLCTLDDFYLLE